MIIFASIRFDSIRLSLYTSFTIDFRRHPFMGDILAEFVDTGHRFRLVLATYLAFYQPYISDIIAIYLEDSCVSVRISCLLFV